MSNAAETNEETLGRPTLRSRIAKVAYDISRESRPRGNRAELRRIQPTGALPAQFWDLVERHDIRKGTDEDFFVRAVPLMARVPHDPRIRPGRALRRAGVSEARFERWLRHDTQSTWDATRRLLAQLDGGIDWGHLGELLYHWDRPEWGEGLRRRIARDFFLTDPDSEPDLPDQPSTSGGL